VDNNYALGDDMAAYPAQRLKRRTITDGARAALKEHKAAPSSASLRAWVEAGN
jgi:hypothetical protein